MTMKEIFFCCILLANALISLVYLVFGLLHVRRCEAAETEEENNTKTERPIKKKQAKKNRKKSSRKKTAGWYMS